MVKGKDSLLFHSRLIKVRRVKRMGELGGIAVY